MPRADAADAAVLNARGDQKVGAVEARGADLDQDFVRLRLGLGQVADFRSLFADHGCFHDASSGFAFKACAIVHRCEVQPGRPGSDGAAPRHPLDWRHEPGRPPAKIAASVCPHDCPSTCALEVEVFDARTIGRVRGARRQRLYRRRDLRQGRALRRARASSRPLAGIRCAASARKARASSRRCRGTTRSISSPEAFIRAEPHHGSETVWPYFYAGTMGYVQRDGIHRLRHAKKYSGFFSTICVNPAWTGFIAGTGKLAGADPREMAKSDLVVIWGTNAVNTQVNVMTHATRARKERGAKIVAVDIYMNSTMKQADLAVLIRPGTDGALACAVMHCLFRDGNADWDYLDRYTDAPRELEEHVRTRDPDWAAAITGCPVETIEDFARLVGERPARVFPARLRLLALAQRRRQYACGELHRRGDRRLASRRRRRLPQQRRHLSSRHQPDRRQRLARSARSACSTSRASAPILTGDNDALQGGPPVTALHIQNTNPMSVAPDQETVKRGFARDDLFVCVHEQFMTDTAKMADVVLPATMLPRARRFLYRRRQPVYSARPEADRAARRMPLQPRGQ